MRWTRGLKVSAQMLWAHKLRTILSLLGIVVGVATVSVMAAVGRGSEEKVLGGIRKMGTNLISVTAGKVTVVAGRERQNAMVASLMPEDANAIQAAAAENYPTFRAISGWIGPKAWVHYLHLRGREVTQRSADTGRDQRRIVVQRKARAASTCRAFRHCGGL